jgi:aspartate ammonia-lyase
MQEAVPSSFGKLFSTYSDALSRDWWRVSKCFERIKIVNLGGSAVGTGITVPRFFIMEVVSELQKLTGLPVTKGENLQDTTNNLDSFVEVHAILKAHAVNLEKISSDLRLLSSDVSGSKEINIPNKQVGSSVMPGKVNPVIPEFVITAAHKIYSNDVLITSLSAQGCLDLNAYIPEIGHAIIESLKLLIAADKTLAGNLFEGLTVNSEKAYEKLVKSPAITTALVPYIGYNKAAEISKEMKAKSTDVYAANKKLKLIDESKLIEILKPENLLKTGYSIGDII